MNKRNRMLIMIQAIILAWALAACENEKRTENDVTENAEMKNGMLSGEEQRITHVSESDTTEQEQDTESQISDIANETMNRLLTAIKDQDARILTQIVDIDRYGDTPDSYLEKALEGWKRRFDLSTIKVELSETNTFPDIGQFRFVIRGSNNGATAEEYIYVHVDRETMKTRVTADMLYYYPFAEQMVNRYLELIRQREHLGLARLLTPDDIDYPILLTNVIMDTYAGKTELSVVTVHFAGFDERGYRYRIQGDSFDHDILIVCGDGLMGIVDDYAPGAELTDVLEAPSIFILHPRIAGLAPGMSADDVRQRLGEPPTIQDKVAEGQAYEEWIYEGIKVMLRDGRYIAGIETTSDQFDTSFGARVGIEASTFFGDYQVAFQRQNNLDISIKDDRIVSISVTD